MARGTAGYGRYDDDRTLVGCPWAVAAAPRAHDMIPCIARDGRLALAGDRPPYQCAGCAMPLDGSRGLWEDLADDYEPARHHVPGDPMDDAEAFKAMVWEMTKPLAEEADDAAADRAPRRTRAMRAEGKYWVVCCAFCGHPGGLHIAFPPEKAGCRCCTGCREYIPGYYGIWSDARTRDLERQEGACDGPA